jgi:exodeoxyribonuclease V alpha subunit
MTEKTAQRAPTDLLMPEKTARIAQAEIIAEMEQILLGRGALSQIDRYFARFILEQAGERGSAELYLVAALTSQRTTAGKHICLDLQHFSEDLAEYFLAPEGDVPSEQLEALADQPEISRELAELMLPRDWSKIVPDFPLVGRVSGGAAPYTPLVYENGRLYLWRYWQYEQKLAGLIRAKAWDRSHGLDWAALASRLTEISPKFRSSGATQPDWQQVAALAALHNRFTVITGGPGTGKTTVVAAILALLLEQMPTARIALCAPTGKAQARLQESILEESRCLRSDTTILTRLAGLATSTIHRLLGTQKNSPYFRHNADNPLPIDVLVIDEASMVSQPLMAKLLDAVRSDARVILLGDKDQLASVEAGSILGDICAAAPINLFPAEFATLFAQLTNGRFPALPISDSKPPLAGCLVELVESHRFAADKGIGRLKDALNQLGRWSDRARQAHDILNIARHDDTGQVRVRALPSSQGRDLENCLRDVFTQPRIETDATESGFLRSVASYVEEKTFDQAFQKFLQFTILCSHRQGPYGSENVNALARKILGQNRQYYRGLPIMITRNDPYLKLYNGDIGLIWPDPAGILRAYFPNHDYHPSDPRNREKYLAMNPSQLPEHEPVYAMTVHKSQGSGFDHVLLILPGHDSSLLTRELIYTGITRARQQVEIWLDDQVFMQGIIREIRRNSGLEEKLRGW